MTARTEAIPTVTADQMRGRPIDGRHYGISLLQMMELAGRVLADLARLRLGRAVSTRSLIVAAGRGNNGGGGLVAARHLANWGASVTALVESTQGFVDVPRRQWEALAHLPVKWWEGTDALKFLDHARTDLIIDALISYGLQGEPRGWTASMIASINTQPAPRIALDIPSGLDATTGEAAVPCVRAAATMTLALPKTGLLPPVAQPYVGDLSLADTDVPPALYSHLHLDPGPIFARRSMIRLDAHGRVISDGG